MREKQIDKLIQIIVMTYPNERIIEVKRDGIYIDKKKSYRYFFQAGYQNKTA